MSRSLTSSYASSSSSSSSAVSRGMIDGTASLHLNAINLKRVTNALNRIERDLPIIPKLSFPSYEMGVLRKKANLGKYFNDDYVHGHAGSAGGIDWDQIETDIVSCCKRNLGADTELPPTVKTELDKERRQQAIEVIVLRGKEEVRLVNTRNGQPSLPGKWKKEPYAFRDYDHLDEYAATREIDEDEGEEFLQLLKTPLKGFLGQAYNYDDHSLTQEWMSAFKDSDLKSGASENEVIRTQVEGLLEIMTSQVQDRVCNEWGVLDVPPVGLGERLKEVFVWGLDCYARRMIEIALEDHYGVVYPPEKEEIRVVIGCRIAVFWPDDDTYYEGKVTAYNAEKGLHKVHYDDDQIEHLHLEDEKFKILQTSTENRVPVVENSPTSSSSSSSKINADMGISVKQMNDFIEKCILPAINAQHPNNAHNLWYALDYIINKSNACKLYIDLAKAVMKAVDVMSIDAFKIHPKGTGVICVDPNGIKPHVVVAEYLGELYPPYRWCERLDVVDQAQKKYGLKPTLPEFYNILLERPRQDPKGYGIMWVDASQRANLGSTCSHSCNPNCTSAVVARNGKLVIVLTTNRPVEYGEELCMDYYSITNSEIEWRAAICLCGMTSCRGSFLNYATQDDLQQVLTQNCGILWLYSALLRACSGKPLSKTDKAVLSRHGMGEAAMGEASPPIWMRKFAAENLRFVEYERKALPSALMRKKTIAKGEANYTETFYTYAAADMDARSVMEQRLQSMVCCFSMISRVLRQTKSDATESGSQLPDFPLKTLAVEQAIKEVWTIMNTIPALIENHVLNNTSIDTKLTDYGRRKLNDALAKIKKEVLDDCKMPKGVNSLRESILNIHGILLTVKDHGNAHARLSLLCDVLVFWAHTSNYSCVQNYTAMKSRPISVVARELGFGIRRSAIFGDGESSTSCHTSTETSMKNDSILLNAGGVPRQEFVHDHAGNGKRDIVNYDEINDDYSNSSSSKSSGGNADINGGDMQNNVGKESLILGNNEVVYRSCKSYNENFIFWQLMGWFHAGTDVKEAAPDLFGCIKLPLPKSCFGPSVRSYGPQERQVLMSHLQNEKAQMQPWPDALRKCFSNFESKNSSVEERKHRKSHKRKRPSNEYAEEIDMGDEKIVEKDPASLHILGSPFVDVTLGQTNAVLNVLHCLSGKSKNTNATNTEQQFDNFLPPEEACAWVQCDKRDCRKWRRVPWNVNTDLLPQVWDCSMNYWDPENASCDTKQDSYDPNRESTLGFEGHAAELTNFEINSWRDVFCVINQFFYEAQVKAIKDGMNESGKPCKLIKFHFKGWPKNFDEWVPIGSPRIAPHNLHTDPKAHNRIEQEKLQKERGFDHNGFPLPKDSPMRNTKKIADKGFDMISSKNTTKGIKPQKKNVKNKSSGLVKSTPAHVKAKKATCSKLPITSKNNAYDLSQKLKEEQEKAEKQKIERTNRLRRQQEVWQEIPSEMMDIDSRAFHVANGNNAHTSEWSDSVSVDINSTVSTRADFMNNAEVPLAKSVAPNGTIQTTIAPIAVDFAADIGSEASKNVTTNPINVLCAAMTAVERSNEQENE